MNQRIPIFLHRAFSLLELIGVLAIISILATILTPVAIRQIDSAFARREIAHLHALADGLRRSIIHHSHIPSEQDWITCVAGELGIPGNDVRYNVCRNERIYLIDAHLQIGPDGGRLPYTQGVAGTPQPIHPRILIVSNLDPTKTLPFSSGVLNADSFAELWNTPDLSVPASWQGRWQSRESAEDLKIERIHLGPLFHRVILNCYAPPRAFYSINDSGTQSVSSEGVSSYYIEGSTLTLHDSNETPELTHIVRRPASFLFEREAWSARLFWGPPSTDAGLLLAQELFLHAPASNATLPTQCSEAMTKFFLRYSDWANDQFAAGEAAAYAALQQASAELQAVTGELVSNGVP